MSLMIYKPGQGYWARMVSGIGGGVLAMAGAAWLVNKLSAIQAEWRIYLQATVFMAVIAVCGLIVYLWVGVKPRSVDFLVATEGEMKKVNWPNRREVTGSTWVVIWCVILLTALLFLTDAGFAWTFQKLGILETTP